MWSYVLFSFYKKHLLLHVGKKLSNAATYQSAVNYNNRKHQNYVYINMCIYVCICMYKTNIIF